MGCSAFHIQQIIFNQKLCYFQDEVRRLRIPAYEELSIENIWDTACTIKNFLKYIPKSWDQPRKVERKYFWEIICTLASDWVVELIQECERLRDSGKILRAGQFKTTYTMNSFWAKKFLEGEY